MLHASSLELSAASQRTPSQVSSKKMAFAISNLTGGTVEENNKTRSFYVLFSDERQVFDQSERAQGPIYVIMHENPG